ncbi:hypothetical protein E2C01_073596 [Portunus trituberculatus]|uniref:Uncharacterized protein n=1 Tax=Portunus trituberculatus TaxID=210409 RepID=A0A5B7IEC4_PORTR|nr:hypothetical protein [Portunus trituberculatus]
MYPRDVWQCGMKTLWRAGEASVARLAGFPPNVNLLLGSQVCSFSLTNFKIFSTSSPHFQTFLRDVTT